MALKVVSMPPFSFFLAAIHRSCLIWWLSSKLLRKNGSPVENKCGGVGGPKCSKNGEMVRWSFLKIFRMELLFQKCLFLQPLQVYYLVQINKIDFFFSYFRPSSFKLYLRKTSEWISLTKGESMSGRTLIFKFSIRRSHLLPLCSSKLEKKRNWLSFSKLSPLPLYGSK